MFGITKAGGDPGNKTGTKRNHQPKSLVNHIHSILVKVDESPVTIRDPTGLGVLIILEENAAVIKMTIKGAKPKHETRFKNTKGRFGLVV